MIKVVASFLLLLSFSQNVFCQKTEENSTGNIPVPTEIDVDDVVFTKVEQEAEFNGGIPAWTEYISKKLSKFDPARNGAPKERYKVVVVFIVNKEGEVSDIRATTNHGYGMEDAVIKAIRDSPKWEPARQNGRLVKAYRSQPVTFVVE